MAKMSIGVSITNTQIFKDIVKILKQVTDDERIPKNIRDEYLKTIEDTIRESD
jgi:uncharacterized protein (UPF0147 family)